MVVCIGLHLDTNIIIKRAGVKSCFFAESKYLLQ